MLHIFNTLFVTYFKYTITYFLFNTYFPIFIYTCYVFLIHYYIGT
jgi:hypothetical protein